MDWKGEESPREFAKTMDYMDLEMVHSSLPAHFVTTLSYVYLFSCAHQF